MKKNNKNKTAGVITFAAVALFGLSAPANANSFDSLGLVLSVASGKDCTKPQGKDGSCRKKLEGNTCTIWKCVNGNWNLKKNLKKSECEGKKPHELVNDCPAPAGD